MRADEWERVDALFHAALDRPPTDRSAYVHAQSLGDESLRREVESLLAAHEHAEGFLEGGAEASLEERLETDANPADVRPGGRLGAFEILDADRRGRDGARSIAPAIRGSIASSRSKCCRRRSRTTRAAGSASIAKPGSSPGWRTRTSARCTTWGSRGSRASRRHSWSWSCSTARRSRRGSRAVRCRSNRPSASPSQIADALVGRARKRHRPSGPQARQHHADDVGREAARLRVGALARAGRRERRDRRRRPSRRLVHRRADHRHVAVHGAGAAARRSRRRVGPISSLSAPCSTKC